MIKERPTAIPLADGTASVLVSKSYVFLPRIPIVKRYTHTQHLPIQIKIETILNGIKKLRHLVFAT
ncbi:hypothetical protein JCM19314_2118 [Nonlabens ulvanivorans]|uniref:Uncharacterized protein n=1 Tax=Nonlabens ulvanivorans TaxID=906888 RepID=A0A090QBS5_NONUL|nr:hypothetical protein JCM19314_2118 [Nonlabens ulvanivorans]